MQDAGEFALLTKEKKGLNARLAVIQKRLNELEKHLLGYIEQGEFPDSSRVGGLTLYTSTTLWASPVDGDYEGASDALEQAGLGDFVGRRFNSQSLSAYFREERKKRPLADVEDLLPESLRGVIKLSENPKLGHNSSG